VLNESMFMKLELESGDEKMELVVEISESERLRLRTIVTVRWIRLIPVDEMGN